MAARCRHCKRPLTVPSPDGFGPVCRRRHAPQPPATTVTHAAPARSGVPTGNWPPELRQARTRPRRVPDGQLTLDDDACPDAGLCRPNDPGCDCQRQAQLDDADWDDLDLDPDFYDHGPDDADWPDDVCDADDRRRIITLPDIDTWTGP